MKELAAQDLVYERQMWPRQEAIDFFTKRGEPLKVQLIEEKTAGQPEVSVYTIKDRDTFVDFCVGPHVPSTNRLKGFKLLTTSNAYWKGDAKGTPMQRVYGTAFFSDKELQAHLHADRGSEEARPPQGRPGARALHVPPVGAGRRVLARRRGRRSTTRSPTTCASVLFPAGYVEVKTPLVYNKALWERSGHWAHYRQNMFLIESEGETMSLKPMNCPGHFLTYASDVRSYRDLPIRYHEQTPLHRNEASGVLSGLTRVRQFSQDDAHCFVTQEQIGEEVERLIGLVQRHLRRLRPVVRGEAVDPARRVPRRDRDVGSRGERSSRRRSTRARLPYDAQREGRRVLRAEDRLRHDRRARAEVAVRHDPARLPAARALRPEVRRRRQHRAPAGRHPPGDLRQLRAVHRAS